MSLGKRLTYKTLSKVSDISSTFQAAPEMWEALLVLCTSTVPEYEVGQADLKP